MSPSPVVEVVDLVKRYAGRTAVDGLSFRVEAGQVTAVLGPNGAGKTTTLETCEGYRRPDSGKVRVLGRDPQRDARELRARVGVMLQAGGVYPSVNAVEMLRHVASLYAHPLEVAGLVERLGLGATGRTPYRRLSGGQQQRLSLAMAVVGRPELVFLDEPTAGLDPQARRATWDLVEEMRRDGVTVVLSTHHMDEAERLADHVVVVDHGRVVAAGSPAELTADGAGGAGDRLRFTARPGLDLASLAAAVPAASRVEEVSPGRYAVHGRVDAHLLADVTAWCAARDVMPEGLSVGHRTLEDVFLELTGTELRS
ncbi:MAG: ABC transporter ATP-binding protein [Spirochaetaceae bacterium]|nr:ABC transporter ATP-binding protein [Spirochaetaceae bacterium]